MATKIYAKGRFGIRSDKLEKWLTLNPVLEKGEPALVENPSEDGEWLKFGDGITPWDKLPWYKGPRGKDAMIDLSYNAESLNAQSGLAVAEAIDSIPKTDVEGRDDDGVFYVYGDTVVFENVPVTAEKYFDIDYDGIVSLKPEYRGHPAKDTYPYSVSDNGIGADGSKINELPEKIIIPDVINGTSVTGFQEGMFYCNERIKELTIPEYIEKIPKYFCSNAFNLRTVNGTRGITAVANHSFSYSSVEKLLFPNLQSMEAGAFGACAYLYSIDIGNVTEIPKQAFYTCPSLSFVKGGSKVTTIGEKAFYLTTNLKNLPLLSNVTSIGEWAFCKSRIQFDWETIKDKCTFSDGATPVMDNTTDYWSGVEYEPCENPLNTMMSQQDARWSGDLIGGTTLDNGTKATFLNGCSVFATLHIHSALSGKTYTHPKEFIEEVQKLDPTLYSDTTGHPQNSLVPALEILGYKVTKLQEDYTEDAVTSEDYSTILTALKNGAYVYSTVSSVLSFDGGHAVAIYGINSNGEVLIVDSSCPYEKYRATVGDEKMKGFLTYRMPLQNLTGPHVEIIIVEKA